VSNEGCCAVARQREDGPIRQRAGGLWFGKPELISESGKTKHVPAWFRCAMSAGEPNGNVFRVFWHFRSAPLKVIHRLTFSSQAD
jgi:hypothetical protein